MYIDRAHRLGKIDSRKNTQRRPIIVHFRDFCDIEDIMSKVTMLKGSGFSLDFDYPKEIQDARSRLWPAFKQMKRECPGARVHIAYPAKLVKNRQLIQDELPEWLKYTGANRLEHVEKVGREQESLQKMYELVEIMSTYPEIQYLLTCMSVTCLAHRYTHRPSQLQMLTSLGHLSRVRQYRCSP